MLLPPRSCQWRPSTETRLPCSVALSNLNTFVEAFALAFYLEIIFLLLSRVLAAIREIMQRGFGRGYLTRSLFFSLEAYRRSPSIFAFEASLSAVPLQALLKTKLMANDQT